MDDHPDIYADNIVISANPYGVTLTLLRTDPGVEPGTEAAPNRIVGRVRMSHELARTMTELTSRTIAQAAQAHQATTDVRH